MEDHDRVSPALASKMRDKAMDKLQAAYRDTWTEDERKIVLAKAQRMMLWSDNDVATDFTVLKDTYGDQVYPKELLRVAMKCYRKYQRQLWDPLCEGELPDKGQPIEEWQFRTFGRLGVFLIDMRGNNINSSGQILEGPIMSDRQRNAFIRALATPGMTGIIVGSEVPFVGESHPTIRKKIASVPTLGFLKNYWPYHIEELVWVLESLFEWKASRPGREVLMLGGDAHIGVESTIADRKTAQTIRHFTTSPLTNNPSNFYPELQGELNERFTYHHKPSPQQRNYCRIDVTFGDDGKCEFRPELIVFKTRCGLKQGKNHMRIKKKMILVATDQEFTQSPRTARLALSASRALS